MMLFLWLHEMTLYSESLHKQQWSSQRWQIKLVPMLTEMIIWFQQINSQKNKELKIRSLTFKFINFYWCLISWKNYKMLSIWRKFTQKEWRFIYSHNCEVWNNALVKSSNIIPHSTRLGKMCFTISQPEYNTCIDMHFLILLMLYFNASDPFVETRKTTSVLFPLIQQKNMIGTSYLCLYLPQKLFDRKRQKLINN